jgi:hypothetical protein
MRWPIEIRVGWRSPPSPPLPVPAPPPAPLLDQRPSDFIGLVSDLARDPKQALTIVAALGLLLVIATGCVVGACFAVAAAAKSVNGVPLRYVWPIGVSSASLVTAITAIIARVVRKRPRPSIGDVANDGKQDAKP